MARMSPIEKIARDLCFNGFARPKDAGCTKAAYWKRLSQEKRDEYIRETSYLCFHIRRLGLKTCHTIIMDEIE